MEKRKQVQKNIQILIIDDHPVFLEGFKSMIKRDGRFTVAGVAGSGKEGLDLAKTLEPDLLVTEIDLPDQDAFQMISKLRNLLPSTPIMILSANSQIGCIVKALQSGAKGYVMKNSDHESILNGMEIISRGSYYLESTIPPDAAMRLNSSAVENGGITINKNRALTPREQEIMGMLAEGLSKKKIAERLSISARTVENHVTSIMKKLSLKSSIEMVRYAVKFGLIDVDNWKSEFPTMNYPKPFLVRKT